MALAGGKARASERHALIERDVVPDLCGLADYHPHPVVDEERVADPRRRVNLDSGHRPRKRGDKARQQWHAGAVQSVRDAVGQERVHPGPGGEDLRPRYAARGRVAALCRGDVAADLVDQPKHVATG